MIIKNIFKVHFLFYIVTFIVIITGFFKPFLLINMLIIVHEIGHLIAAVYFKWQIDKIIIFPFGGVTIFKDFINKPIKEEFIILIMGPLFQTIFYLIIIFLFGENDLLKILNYSLLLFNLLPIYPLDGSKFIYLFFQKILPFKLSHILIIIVSLIFIFLLLFYFKFNLILLILLFLLLLKNLKEIKNHQFIFNKFLLERYLYDFNFKKKKYLKNTNLNIMYRDYYHYFYYKNNYITEKKLLSKKFDFN